VLIQAGTFEQGDKIDKLQTQADLGSSTIKLVKPKVSPTLIAYNKPALPAQKTTRRALNQQQNAGNFTSLITSY